VCGGGGGDRKHVYTSISNQLEISVTGLDWTAQFIIQYEGLFSVVTGCVRNAGRGGTAGQVLTPTLTLTPTLNRNPNVM